MKEKKLKKFGLTNLVALILLVLILSIVPTVVIVNENNKAINENFFGNISEFSGVLEIWNIDTFEGGSASKQSFLENVAREFEKEYKCTYVHIDSYSVEGMILALAEGKRPDAFSFGSGVGEYLMDEIVEFSGNFDALKTFKKSGIINGQQKAVPYACGGYGLFSTSEKLTLSGKEPSSNLLDIVYTSGYEKKLRKSNKTIDSVSFGSDGYVLPEGALYFAKQQPVLVKSMATAYDAYVGFVGYESSTILLGNHRDLARLQNKLNMSQIQDLLFCPLSGYTDLVQYLSVAANEDGLRQKMAVTFIEFCMTDEQQKKLTEISMFSTKQIKLYEGARYYDELEIALQSNPIVPPVFASQTEREARLQEYTS